MPQTFPHRVYDGASAAEVTAVEPHPWFLRQAAAPEPDAGAVVVEVDLTELDHGLWAESAPTRRDAPERRRPSEPPAQFSPTCIEVAVAPYSDSNFYEDLDGRVGVFVATYRDLPMGKPIRVEVHLPGGRGFEAIGKVEWARTAEDCWPGVGLRFVSLSGAARALVRRFMRCRPPMLA